METRIENVTVVCPTRKEPIQGTSVQLRDRRIASINAAVTASADAVRLDGTGLFMIPGIIDAHTHLTFRQTYGPMKPQLQHLPPAILGVRAARAAIQYLRQGVTTVRDLGGRHDVARDIAKLVEHGYLPGPRILTAGSPLSVSGGHSITAELRVDGPYEARKAGREWAAKYDWVKIFASYDPINNPGGELARPEFRQDEIQAIAEEAHNVGKRVAAHCNGTAALRNCIRGGVDTIEHGIYLNEELADEMIERSMTLVPTLSCYRQNTNPRFGRGGAWGDRLAAMLESHALSYEVAVHQGVHIALGLDSIGDLGEELQLLKDLGHLSEHELLRIATLHGAEALDLSSQIGSVEEGKQADLLLVGTDPQLDLRESLQDIRYVIKDGRPLRPAEICLSLEEETVNYNSLVPATL